MIEYEETNLTDLVHVNNRINYFIVNTKEEHIQDLINMLEKLEIIGEKCFKILGKR